jgi:hypothetical protein
MGPICKAAIRLRSGPLAKRSVRAGERPFLLGLCLCSFNRLPQPPCRIVCPENMTSAGRPACVRITPAIKISTSAIAYSPLPASSANRMPILLISFPPNHFRHAFQATTNPHFITSAILFPILKKNSYGKSRHLRIEIFTKTPLQPKSPYNDEQLK